MNDVVLFLIQAIIISLSGVMAPGAMTAATIAQGTQNRWAGTLISIGHGIVEIPLIFALMLGLHFFFEMVSVKIGIGLLGGGFLLWMGYGMLRQLGQSRTAPPNNSLKSDTITVGIILSATNPYFLLWWATVGLNLVLGAKDLGLLALILFAAVHWLCDFVWLSILSFGAFYTNKGAGLFGRHFEKGLLVFCGAALLGFGVKFLYDALTLWFS
ncbi:MAG: LysE family translocator [Planctomycetales bacterium]|nr:LysE family translocator [Planctomycetales bacterium]